MRIEDATVEEAEGAFGRAKQEAYKVLSFIEQRGLMPRDKIQWHIGRLLAAQTARDLEPYPTVFARERKAFQYF